MSEQSDTPSVAPPMFAPLPTSSGANVFGSPPAGAPPVPQVPILPPPVQMPTPGAPAVAGAPPLTAVDILTAPPAADPFAPAAPEAVAVPAAPAAPAVDLQQQLAQVARDYGVAPNILAQFKDVDSALTAITLFAAQSAAAAPQPQAYAPPVPQYQPQQYAPPVALPQPLPAAPQLQPQIPAGLSLQLDDAAIDNASVENFKALQQYTAQLEQKLNQVVQGVEQQQVYAQTQAREQSIARAESVLAQANDPRYGVEGSRTPAQEAARAELFNLTDRIQIGLYNQGQQLPSVDKVLRQAMRLHTTAAPAIPVPAPPVQPAPALPVPVQFAPPPRSAAPLPTGQLGAHTHLGNLHQDPAFMSTAARLLSRQ